MQPMPIELKLIVSPLDEIADALDAMPREGAEADDPEGVRRVCISDTLLKAIASRIRMEV